MTAPAKPSAARALAAVFQLESLRIARGRKLRLASASVAVVVLGILLIRYIGEGEEPVSTLTGAIDVGYFGFLAYLLPYLFQAGAIAEEVESRTITYLLGRPVSRFALTLGKYLAGFAFTAITVVFGLLVLHVGALATVPDALLEMASATARAASALVLLGACYGSLCLLFGALLPEASGIASLVYLGLIELLGGKLPGAFRYLSMNFHARNLAGRDLGGLMVDSVPPLPALASAAVITLFTLFFLGLAALVVRTQEFRFSRA